MVTVAKHEATPSYTVEDLARLTTTEATELYQRGTVPPMTALDGSPRGRMLAVARLDGGGVAARLRAFAGSNAFPWAGKSFAAADSKIGSGINRVRLLGTRDLFPFDTLVGASAVDGRPCIILDYDKPANPWFIRKIHDELREVAPDLYLGPAMWKTAGEPRLLLYFAIDKQ